MRTRLIPALAMFTLVTIHTPAHGIEGISAYEVWLGVGGAVSFENNVFNISADTESSPEGFYSIVGIANRDARLAYGLHLYGGTETTPEFVVQDQSGGTQLVRFELVTLNFGLRIRYTFTRGTLSPYALAGLSLAHGSVDSRATGELTYTGASGCVGAGAGMGLGRRFMLSAEGIGSFGTANWKRPPFVNSAGGKFNPSLVSGTLQLGFRWGTKP